MIYDFNTPIDRRVSGAVKWVDLPEGIIPLNIADMEFKIMPEVIDEMIKTANYGDFGYIGMTENDYQAVINWIEKRRKVKVSREHIIATPGVLYAARIALSILTNPGDKVIVQTPLHTPSIATPCIMDRIKVENRLIYKNGSYYIDYDNLEYLFKNGAKVLMMCAPQNPTGRVWTYEELKKVGEIVNKYNGYIICDEIHSDIVWNGNVHVSPTQIPEIMDRSIGVFSTSKTFNMGGFHVGTAIVPNAELRDKMVKAFYSIGHVCDRPAVMCMRAQTAAYNKGERWLEEMLSYVGDNFDYTLNALKNTPIKATHPEGTFLLWCDIESLGWNAEKLRDVMFNEWKVLPDPGSYYDTKDWATYTGLEHHIRLNLALPKPILIQAIDRITKYFK